MRPTVTEQQPLFLGIDGGGSKCRVLLMSAQGQVLGAVWPGQSAARYATGYRLNS